MRHCAIALILALMLGVTMGAGFARADNGNVAPPISQSDLGKAGERTDFEPFPDPAAGLIRARISGRIAGPRQFLFDRYRYASAASIGCCHFRSYRC